MGSEAERFLSAMDRLERALRAHAQELAALRTAVTKSTEGVSVAKWIRAAATDSGQVLGAVTEIVDQLARLRARRGVARRPRPG